MYLELIFQIYKMTRYIKCRDYQNFLKVKKLEVKIIFFKLNIFTKIFALFCRSNNQIFL